MTLYENMAEYFWMSCVNEDVGSAELYIDRLTEKALFGSMDSSMKKWTKQINKLKVEIAAYEDLPSTPKALNDTIKNWKASADALLAKINDKDFKYAMKMVDDNTGLFGRDKGKLGPKGSGFTSTRINKDNDLVEESYIDELTRIREAEEQSAVQAVQAQITEFAQAAKDFTEKTKLLANAGVQMPGSNFKKVLKHAGPVLTLGALVLSIGATAMTGGAAAPVMMGVATGMKAAGLTLTAGRSFAGAGRAFARGENGKGALKTVAGAASLAAAGYSVPHGIGQVNDLNNAAQQVSSWDPNAALNGPAGPDGSFQQTAPKTGWLYNKIHGAPQDMNIHPEAANTYGMQFGDYGNIADMQPTDVMSMSPEQLANVGPDAYADFLAENPTNGLQTLLSNPNIVNNPNELAELYQSGAFKGMSYEQMGQLRNMIAQNGGDTSQFQGMLNAMVSPSLKGADQFAQLGVQPDVGIIKSAGLDPTLTNQYVTQAQNTVFNQASYNGFNTDALRNQVGQDAFYKNMGMGSNTTGQYNVGNQFDQINSTYDANTNTLNFTNTANGTTGNYNADGVTSTNAKGLTRAYNYNDDNVTYTNAKGKVLDPSKGYKKWTKGRG